MTKSLLLTCSCIHAPTHPSVHPSIHPSICLSVHVYPPICPYSLIHPWLHSAKEHEARLRRKAVRKGLTLEEVRKQYELIPHEHIDHVLDRDSLKTQATNFERKARKIERRTSVKLPNLPGGGSHARLSKPELKWVRPLWCLLIIIAFTVHGVFKNTRSTSNPIPNVI